MQKTASAALIFILSSAILAHGEQLGPELEEAALIGTAMYLCDMNHGVGSGGWNDAIMRGADRMHVSLDAATEFVEARQREIIAYLNRTNRLDEFCRNARAGKLK